MRFAISLAAVVVTVTALVVTGAPAVTTPTGTGSPSCLRGHWVATQAETRRVLFALAPVPGMEVTSKLYMQFRNGLFQYGTPSMILRTEIGDAVLTVKARFFTLAPYTARAGALTLEPGESTIEYDEFKGTKNGRTYSVPGPPTRTTRTPGGVSLFQCRGNTLKVRLPRFASLNWITLHRG